MAAHFSGSCSAKAVDRAGGAIALCAVRRYMHTSIMKGGLCRPMQTSVAETSMRAEIERLVEEIKQSVGLLRRHL
jgi:hypothetical protein